MLAMTAFLEAAPALDPSSAAAEQLWVAIAAPTRSALVVAGIAAAALLAQLALRTPPASPADRRGALPGVRGPVAPLPPAA